MDENAALIDKILREDAISNGYTYPYPYPYDHDYDVDTTTAWKTVSYSKRHRKPNQNHNLNYFPLPESSSTTEIFQHSDYNHDSAENDVFVACNENSPMKKPKSKKPKKPKVSVSEAAAQIDADHLAAFLADISVSYESQQDIQLMRFADYFGRAFASVGSAQFPWMKMLNESNVAKLVDIPLSHIGENVYKTSLEWLNKQSLEALGSFVLWLWDSILSDLASHQGTVKGSQKKPQVQQPISKSQVAIFVVLAMTLRRKPDILISILGILKESQKYAGQDKLPVIVWVIAQACQGDLGVAMYMWIQILLPMLTGKSVNPQSRDLILQLLERILSMPKARTILLNGAVRKGERLVPPAELVSLMRLTFPPASTRNKATERCQAVYPILKEVALAGSPGSKALKQVSQQIFGLALKAASEGVSELSNEAGDVAIWCLVENSECYRQWENLYLDNIEGSVAVLKKLSEERKFQSAKYSTINPVQATMTSLKQKTQKALAVEEFADRRHSLKETEKYCKSLLALLSTGWGWKQATVATILLVTAAMLYSSIQSDYYNLRLLGCNV